MYLIQDNEFQVFKQRLPLFMISHNAAMEHIWICKKDLGHFGTYLPAFVWGCITIIDCYAYLSFIYLLCQGG